MTVGLIVACMPAFATVVRHNGFPLGTFWTFLGSKMFAFSRKSKYLMHKVPSKDSSSYDSERFDSPREEEGMASSGGTYVESKQRI